MNKELETLLEENHAYRYDSGDRVFYDSNVEFIAEQYAQSQTEALKKEIEELKAELSKIKNNSVTLTISQSEYQTKWCNCKNLEKSTANFICHGQCKY